MKIEDTLSAYDREIGCRIRVRRKALGLTQAELGQTIGVSFQQIQKYERGRNRVSSSTLIALAQVLGVKPSQLLDGLAGDAAVATPAADLVRDLLAAPHGLAIAKAVRTLSTRDAALVAAFATRLAGAGEQAGAPLSEAA
jgi:transcriptional regulator with XRE-family HTH domain